MVKIFKVLFLSAAVLSLVVVWGCSCGSKSATGGEGTIAQAPMTVPDEKPATPAETDKAPVAPIGPKEQPEVKEAVRPEKALKDVYFDFDKYDIKGSETAALQANAAWMKDNPKYVVTIEGHCDERGTVEYNLALGERRAEAARDYLVSLGVDPAKLKTVSYGKSKPADPGHDEAAWAKNRRAHFVVQ